MANLTNLYSMVGSELRNRIVAACWNKAKAILTDAGAPAVQIKYAKSTLLSQEPVQSIVVGASVLIQDADPVTDEVVQNAVDAVVEKFLSVEA